MSKRDALKEMITQDIIAFLVEDRDLSIWNIGDSRQPAHVLNSVRDGFFVGKNI